MEFPITAQNIDENINIIMDNAKQDDQKLEKESLNYYVYNYILIRILYIHFISDEIQSTYKTIEEFLRKILSDEGLGKCKITINYLLNQPIKDKNKIHTKLYTIMNQEIILI